MVGYIPPIDPMDLGIPQNPQIWDPPKIGIFGGYLIILQFGTPRDTGFFRISGILPIYGYFTHMGYTPIFRSLLLLSRPQKCLFSAIWPKTPILGISRGELPGRGGENPPGPARRGGGPPQNPGFSRILRDPLSGPQAIVDSGGNPSRLSSGGLL